MYLFYFILSNCPYNSPFKSITLYHLFNHCLEFNSPFLWSVNLITFFFWVLREFNNYAYILFFFFLVTHTNEGQVELAPHET